MNKIYVFPTIPNSTGDCAYMAVAEDGEDLATHVSSSEDWGRHDLGVGGDGFYKEKYTEKYPDGYEVEYVPDWHTHPALVKLRPKENTQNADSTHLTKRQALDAAGFQLGQLPNTIVCVACGFTKPATWEVVDRIFIDDEDTVGVQITLSSGIYAGWCSYTADPERGFKAGDHCPPCYEARRKA